MNHLNHALKLDSNPSTFYAESGYEPLPCIVDRNGVYPSCTYDQAILPMEEAIAVGFGCALLTKTNEKVYMYDEMTTPSYGNYMTVAQAEELAAKDPNHDWRIHFIAPLHERHYQRQGKQNWVLYEKGPGFA